MTQYHLAQLNIAVMKAPLDSPIMADFVANLDRINALADTAPGFIWRLQTDDGNATTLRPFGDDTIVNMSVWHDAEALNHYVYKSAHVEVMRRRKAWFRHMTDAYMVLWWVPAGHHPILAEARARLELLRQNGPTSEAFTLRHLYPAPNVEPANAPFGFGDACPAT